MSLLFGAREVRGLSFPNAEQMIARDRSMRAVGSSVYTAHDALRVAAVTACVGLRAGAFAQLPMKVYGEVNGLPQLLPDQPPLVRRPSELVVPSVWKTQMSISRDLWGFALGRITAFDGAMYAKQAEWIDPSSVAPEFDGVKLDWRIGGKVYDGNLFVYIPSRWVLPGTPIGMPPLAHSGLVELAKRAQDFGRDWFRNGAVPSSIIYSDRELDKDAAEGLLARILERWSDRKPAILGSGLRYEKISIPANESQFLETVRQAAADIAMSFNMPPEKIGAAISGSSVTYANREQNQQQYLVDSVNPDLVVVQESLDRYLRPGQYTRFNTGAFLQSDLKTRMEGYKLAAEVQQLTGAVLYTEDEMRALEERAPLPPREQTPSKTWQAVGLPALVDGGIITENEAREELGRAPVAGGDQLRRPTDPPPGGGAV